MLLLGYALLNSALNLVKVGLWCQGMPQKDLKSNNLQYNPTLVTQSMLQRRPNQTELRSMDSYIQILFSFQKSK